MEGGCSVGTRVGEVQKAQHYVLLSQHPHINRKNAPRSVAFTDKC